MDFTWLPIQVTNSFIDTNATNETLLALSVKCLTLAVERKNYAKETKLSDEEKARLVKYFDCLIQMETSLKEVAL